MYFEEVESMQDMISKIIELDKEERRINEEVERSIASSKDDLVEYRERIKKEYLDRARKRIDRNRENEKRIAQDHFEKIVKQQEEEIKSLEKISEEKMDQWVNEVVKRVIGE